MPRFILNFWEIIQPKGWEFFGDTVQSNLHFGGYSKILYWQKGNGVLSNYEKANIRGRSAWNSKGINVGQMGGLASSLFTGNLYGVNSAAIIPKNIEDCILIIISVLVI